MNKDRIVQITLALYRVTDCFPEKEPLKYYLREVSVRILAFAVSPKVKDCSYLQEDFELLEIYFRMVKLQKWVAQENILVLEREYGAIKESLANPMLDYASNNGGHQKIKRKQDDHERREKVISKNEALHSPDERKHKIAAIVKKNERVTLKNIMQIFPHINRRTLIRDLENLLREEVIKKEGNGRGAFYLSNGQSHMVTQMVTESLVQEI